MSLHLLCSLSRKHFFSSAFFSFGSVGKFQFYLQYLAKILKLSYFFLIFPERPKYFIHECLYYNTQQISVNFFFPMELFHLNILSVLKNRDYILLCFLGLWYSAWNILENLWMLNEGTKVRPRLLCWRLSPWFWMLQVWEKLLFSLLVLF